LLPNHTIELQKDALVEFHVVLALVPSKWEGLDEFNNICDANCARYNEKDGSQTQDQINASQFQPNLRFELALANGAAQHVVLHKTKWEKKGRLQGRSGDLQRVQLR
jgi:hypothetical protein